MKPKLKISDAMTPYPVSVSPDTLISEVYDLMVSKHIRHVPIVKNSSPVGIVSERDIHLARSLTESSELDGMQVSMVSPLETFIVELDTPLDEVLQQMLSRHIGSVLVQNKDILVGIFTLTDACRALQEVMSEES